ncbi:hypothetical protein SEA_VANLEE_95 [Gordonia phage VanLee]|uniref:Uncharacterized protein n=1 Tax=Gordonia phage VanLee TaxID=2845816 RepID=A0A8F2D9H8_9CAUD|nr:hypothetical protein QEH49_gp095 [Gordonia phage VanLee]QWS68212.1 hypothetical protein SEA_VANLEE_95 [Gordonia phage VanLee]
MIVADFPSAGYRFDPATESTARAMEKARAALLGAFRHRRPALTSLPEPELAAQVLDGAIEIRWEPPLDTVLTTVERTEIVIEPERITRHIRTGIPDRNLTHEGRVYVRIGFDTDARRWVYLDRALLGSPPETGALHPVPGGDQPVGRDVHGLPARGSEL